MDIATAVLLLIAFIILLYILYSKNHYSIETETKEEKSNTKTNKNEGYQFGKFDERVVEEFDSPGNYYWSETYYEPKKPSYRKCSRKRGQ